ncbi:MAG: sigma-54 dependent transcriptional regulator [Crocinitomicaceae bacterium]|nr:sigma-54 dependent transcriptional regulator [Crocinitomicaceae bacterium]MDG1658757.1 sigma-54 dependent transcriptional regulator [Crocinitomicaceae bacterium]|tara:strand:+ start:5175 stop:6509 length:1335 start_codon:yes stop_codon:yes gene_type:complete
MENLSIVIAEDDQWYAEFIKHTILLTGEHEVQIVDTVKDLMSKIVSNPDIITLDFNLPDGKGEKTLDRIRAKNKEVDVVVISGQEDIQTAINLLSKGAFDYVVKNAEARNRIIQIVRSILEKQNLKEQIVNLEKEVRTKHDYKETLISNSKSFKKIYDLIHKASETNINVSIYGDTGTGKEVAAKAIHFNSTRAKHPFVAVNLSALSESLLESELFGYVKGAFTGADQDRKGKFEEANRGTIFLDEIAEISEAIQVKLLRVLQEMEINRVGSNKIVALNCRIVVATNKDLAEEVRKGNFRQDLFYRLMGLPIYLPKLIERDNDVIFLAQYFAKEYAHKNETTACSINEGSIVKLLSYHYPGNVRELKSIIDLACVLTNDSIIKPEDIVFNDLAIGFVDFDSENQSLKEHNRRLIESLLKKHNNNVRLVAKKLDIGKSTIYRMIR